MPTPAISHIILTVSDLDKARAFYGDLLGFLYLCTFERSGDEQGV